MSETTLKAVEGSVANMIGAAFSGATPPVGPAVVSPAAYEGDTFEFDSEFQTKIAALAIRDNQFVRRVGHALRPEFFENIGEAALVNLSLRHFDKHGTVPDKATMTTLVRDAVEAKVIRRDIVPLVVAARKDLLHADISSASFAEEKVIEFARHQAVSQAVLKSADLLEQKKFSQIEKIIQEAISIGINEESDAYDYFARIKERSEIRLERLSGKRPPQGITTGILKMDELLYHRGWGRRELTTIMGGAKAGKTTALINFAKAASLAGHSVLYVSLEVGANIISDRLDACMSETLMKELDSNVNNVREKIEQLEKRSGPLIMHEYPSGTLTPKMLRALLDRYKAPGRYPNGRERPPINFDLIVVDYADIMAPNFRTTDAIENSKTVYVDLRAIAFDYNAAVLTATQTNREGYKAAVAKAEHVAEDFNKVRTVDLMISINKTEEEAARGEARLFFAASRNQESGFTIVIKQNIAMMKFVEHVLRVE